MMLLWPFLCSVVTTSVFPSLTRNEVSPRSLQFISIQDIPNEILDFPSDLIGDIVEVQRKLQQQNIAELVGSSRDDLTPLPGEDEVVRESDTFKENAEGASTTEAPDAAQTTSSLIQREGEEGSSGQAGEKADAEEHEDETTEVETTSADNKEDVEHGSSDDEPHQGEKIDHATSGHGGEEHGDYGGLQKDRKGGEHEEHGEHGEHGDEHGEGGHGHGHGHGAFPNKAFGPVAFVLFMLAIALLAHFLEIILPDWIQFPHTVVLFFLGFGLGMAGMFTDPEGSFHQIIESWKHIDAHIIFWILLPPLLFEDASGTDWHVFSRLYPNALLLAFPGVMMNFCMTAGIVYFAFDTEEVPFDMPFIFLMAAILAATDPVAVIGTLNSLGAPLKLSTLIAGEALMNDGSAVVLFKICFSTAVDGKAFEWGAAAVSFCRLAFGGFALGIIMALLLHFVLRPSRDHFTIQMVMIIAVTFGTFFIAEQHEVEVSAVLAVVTVGYYMSWCGNHLIAPKNVHNYHSIMGIFAFLANESIFVLAGLVCSYYGVLTKHHDKESGETAHLLPGSDHPGLAKDGKTDHLMVWNAFSTQNILELFLLYIIIHITRGLTIMILWPLMRKLGYGVTLKEAFICLWGGLRGAVGLGLALLVDLGDTTDTHAAIQAHRLAFHVSWVTILTLVINGSTLGFVYRTIVVYPAAKFKELIHLRALANTDLHADRGARLILKDSWFFHNSFLDLCKAAIPQVCDATQKEQIWMAAENDRKNRRDDEEGGRSLAHTEAEEEARQEHLSVHQFITEVLLLGKDGMSTVHISERFHTKMKARRQLKSRAPLTDPFRDKIFEGNKNFDRKLNLNERNAVYFDTLCQTLTVSREKKKEKDDGKNAACCKRPHNWHDGPVDEDETLTHVAFRPGRNQNTISVRSLANVLRKTAIGGGGYELTTAPLKGPKLPRFGINSAHHECELRLEGYRCNNCGMAPGPCKPCLEFGKEVTAGNLRWGPRTLNEAQRWHAARRWRILRKLAVKVVKAKHNIDKKFQQMTRDEEKQARQMEDMVASRDILTYGEAYQGLFQRLDLHLGQLHSTNMLHLGTYQLIKDSLKVGQDAVNGELSNDKQFRGNPALVGIHQLPDEEQMRASLDVFWEALTFAMQPGRQLPLFRFSQQAKDQDKFLECLRRVEAGLVVLFFLEDMESSDPTLQGFPGIQTRVRDLLQRMQNYLEDIARREPGFFLLAEHVVALRMACVEKRRQLERAALDPAVIEEKGEHIDDVITQLLKYKPTPHQILWAREFAPQEGGAGTDKDSISLAQCAAAFQKVERLSSGSSSSSYDLETAANEAEVTSAATRKRPTTPTPTTPRTPLSSPSSTPKAAGGAAFAVAASLDEADPEVPEPAAADAAAAVAATPAASHKEDGGSSRQSDAASSQSEGGRAEDAAQRGMEDAVSSSSSGSEGAAAAPAAK